MYPGDTTDSLQLLVTYNFLKHLNLFLGSNKLTNGEEDVIEEEEEEEEGNGDEDRGGGGYEEEEEEGEKEEKKKEKKKKKLLWHPIRLMKEGGCN